MEERELICIQCPLGCRLSVKIGENGVSVSGNTCPRGAIYGEKEVTHPTRTVTSTVAVLGGELDRVSVKTDRDIPKEAIFDVMRKIRAKRVEAPVTIGDVLIENAAGSGADIVATKTVNKKTPDGA